MSATRSVMLATALLALSACATTGTDGLPQGVPADAEQVTRTESNGDRITEFRVAGQLRAVQVVPSRGPTYYLYDHNGDGRIDNEGDNPPQTYFKLFGW